MALNQAGSSRARARSPGLERHSSHIAPTGKGCVCLVGTYCEPCKQVHNRGTYTVLYIYNVRLPEGNGLIAGFWLSRALVCTLTLTEYFWGHV